MKKSKDISKYDIDWQVFRVGLKKLPTLEAKVEAATSYLINHLNKADRERVLNYLEGLSMAYKDEERTYVLDVKDELSTIEVSDDNPQSTDFSKHMEKDLFGVAKDLLVRHKKWLDNGYVNKEGISFLVDLLTYLKADSLLMKLHQDIERASLKPNTHKFFF